MPHDRVAHLFNEMRHDYDDLSDLWYAWLFSRLHYLITRHVLASPRWRGGEVIDVGCGTGFQSFLYARAGARVVGVDIAADLVAAARHKAEHLRSDGPLRLFPAHFDFVRRYDARLAGMLSGRVGSRPVAAPRFEVGDARDLPYDDARFDHLNCCGSTLSFIADYTRALAETARVLRPGGTFVLEVEAKYNCDLLWPVVDACLGGRLEYEATFGAALRDACSSPRAHISVEYPFGEISDPVYMDIRLFAARTLRRELAAHGLRVERMCSIHSLTNILPSTLLDSPKPSRGLVRVFRLLAALEERAPFRLPGCSLVLFGHKS